MSKEVVTFVFLFSYLLVRKVTFSKSHHFGGNLYFGGQHQYVNIIVIILKFLVFSNF